MQTRSPLLSVIIPTYNRPDRLRHCLKAVAKQTYDHQCFEVIVVDDGSHTSMAPIIGELASKVDITLLQQQNSGPARARNKGAQQAHGQYLIFTDDDCTPTPDWLSQIAAHFAVNPQSFIGGHTLNALPDNPYSTASQLLIDYLYGYYNAEPGQASFFASNNFALPADLFHQMGGFDTTFPLAAGEDRELCDRIHQQGIPMRYVPEAKIWHAHELSLKKYWRQHFNYGRGAYHFHQVRSRRKAAPVQVEPLTFYTRLLTYSFKRSNVPSALFLAGLMLVSQVANVAGFFWEKRQQPAN
ncbi:MAG: glycosyltransferase family 2 protein [Cyanobacteria bacterium P01_D01_bin.44]